MKRKIITTAAALLLAVVASPLAHAGYYSGV
jgi:hypothetical protein